jgi:predicted  nucleic acid-binding Zn-ribbon protein
LENKIQRLSRDVVDMEWRKKHLRDEVARLISNKSQLENLQKQYQMEIEQKKHIISNLDQQLNQKISALEEKLS